MIETFVKLEGHIIDSLTLSKVFDEILRTGGNYQQICCPACKNEASAL